jgi:hypothetical protein
MDTPDRLARPAPAPTPRARLDGGRRHGGRAPARSEARPPSRRLAGWLSRARPTTAVTTTAKTDTTARGRRASRHTARPDEDAGGVRRYAGPDAGLSGRGGVRPFGARESELMQSPAPPSRALHCTHSPRACGRASRTHPTKRKARAGAGLQATAPSRHRSRRSGAHSASGSGVHKPDSPLLRAHGFISSGPATATAAAGAGFPAHERAWLSAASAMSCSLV